MAVLHGFRLALRPVFMPNMEKEVINADSCSIKRIRINSCLVVFFLFAIFAQRKSHCTMITHAQNNILTAQPLPISLGGGLPHPVHVHWFSGFI